MHALEENCAYQEEKTEANLGLWLENLIFFLFFLKKETQDLELDTGMGLVDGNLGLVYVRLVWPIHACRKS